MVSFNNMTNLKRKTLAFSNLLTVILILNFFHRIFAANNSDNSPGSEVIEVISSFYLNQSHPLVS